MTRELQGPRKSPEDGRRDEGEVKVLVKSEQFAEFNAWMDAELAKLEARWLHLAAPGADSPRRKMPQPQ